MWGHSGLTPRSPRKRSMVCWTLCYGWLEWNLLQSSERSEPLASCWPIMTVVCVCRGLVVVKDKLADSNIVPLLCALKCLKLWKLWPLWMQSIILATHCADLDFSHVSSAVDCVQLALCIRYGLYMFGWEEGSVRQPYVYVWSLQEERERLVALINTCRHGP